MLIGVSNQMTDCPACGFEFEAEPRVCSKCEHLIREKINPVPSVMELQDLSEEQLRKVAETHEISGYRRLSYKGLLHSLNNQRIEDEESDARRNRIPRLKLDFNQAISQKRMDRAKQLLHNLIQIGADGLDEWQFKFEKEDLLIKLDDVNSSKELPETAFYFDDEEVKEKLAKVKDFFERRESLISRIENSNAPSEITEEMIYCDDEEVSKFARSTRLTLIGEKKEKAALALSARKVRKARKSAKLKLKNANTPGGISEELLSHEDSMIRDLANSRLHVLKSRANLIGKITSASKPHEIPELALKSDDSKLKKLAKERLQSLLYQEKQELLLRILKCNKVSRLPSKARKHSDSKIREAYENRITHIRFVNRTIKSIEVALDYAQLEEILIHAPLSDLIDKAVSMKKEELEQMPALLKHHRLFYRIAFSFLFVSTMIFAFLQILPIVGYLIISFIVVYWSKFSALTRIHNWRFDYQNQQDQSISETIEREIADIDSALMSDLKVGDSVTVDYLGKQYEGTILEITGSKRVMVRNEDTERIISVPTYALYYSSMDNAKS